MLLISISISSDIFPDLQEEQSILYLYVVNLPCLKEQQPQPRLTLDALLVRTGTSVTVSVKKK